MIVGVVEYEYTNKASVASNQSSKWFRLFWTGASYPVSDQWMNIKTEKKQHSQAVSSHVNYQPILEGSLLTFHQDAFLKKAKYMDLNKL